MPMSELRKQPGLTIAVISAAAMITHQVAGKATRDALFLSAFGIAALPEMFVVAAIFSIGTGLLFAHMLRVSEPRRTIPIAFLLSGVMQIAEWALSYVSLPAAAVIVYLHMAAVGSALISGFWSVLNEKFDPYSARKEFARITAGGTLGGLVGGLMAGAIPSFTATTAILPVLAVLHLGCAVIIRILSRTETKVAATQVHQPEEIRSGYAALRDSSYLRQIASVVLLGTISAALLDYVFKAHAAANYQSSGQLVQFFAVFYAGTALLTFVIQTTAGRLSLERFGLVRTVGVLPVSVFGGAVGNLLLPGLGLSMFARGSEAVLRSSLFRSGYELLYTPVPQEEKRAAKPIIDVVVERVGDLAGGLAIKLALLLSAGAGLYLLTIVTVWIAAFELFFAARLNRGYVEALEHSLRHRAVEIDPASVQDRTTRDTLMRTIGIVRAAAKPVTPAASTESRHADPIIQRLIDLRSGDANRVRKALRSDNGLDALLVPQVIRLIGWDEVSNDAMQTLREHSGRVTGQLTDALTDLAQEFAVRRRIPRILSLAATQKSVDGLTEALSDRRFEVRLQSGRALSHIRDVNPDLAFDRTKIFNLIVRDIAIDKNVLLRQQLENEDQGNDDPQLTHIFRLLGLVLPSEPVRMAYQGLRSDDRTLRGTSLEYLERILPERVREALWPVIEQQTALRSLALR
jgi:AAA family ATP:ADP antiporter